MTKTLKIDIDCGDLTCASKPGKFCEWIGSRKFGQIARCMLFDQDLELIDGWTHRCEQCLQHQEK